jgi:hypothetical protein
MKKKKVSALERILNEQEKQRADFQPIEAAFEAAKAQQVQLSCRLHRALIEP